MPKKPKIPDDSAELRRRAEARLSERPGERKSDADNERQLHELEVHQIELELQNAELQKARNGLEVALEKYTDLYDFAPVGYFSIDESGVVLEANLTSTALLGVERSRLLQRRLLQFVSATSRPAFLEFLKKVFSRPKDQGCEALMEKAGGGTFWARLRATPAVAPKGGLPWCRMAIADITSLRQAEELLRRNEALFSTLIEQAPLGVYVVDGQLRLLQANPKARPLFRHIHPLIGRALDEIVGLLWPKKIADEVLAHFRHTLQTGQPHDSSGFSGRRRDIAATETYEWQLQRILLPGGDSGVVCFFNDVTERKRSEAVQRRIEVLAASNRKLEKEIVRRRTVGHALKKSERHLSRLLGESRDMQEDLRQLSHQMLHAQEEERKNISRELHDEVAQTLVGINVHLAGLTLETTGKPRDLERKIARTQRLVEKSVEIVHRFARDLRPTALDDLGLIPTLHAFMKEFTRRTGVRVHLRAFAAVEQLDITKRTVMYRVAHEALNNVARHAQASQVEVSIQKLAIGICMKIKDDGKSFQVQRGLRVRRNNRLGMLGMQERLEMVGGNFSVESAPGKGTTIRALIPFGKVNARGLAKVGKKQF